MRLAVSLLAALVAVTGLVACRPRSPEAGSPYDNLQITRYRYVIDDHQGIGRVFAEVQNSGKSDVREVEARAFLRSRGGEIRGENATVLRNLKPGERRAFSVEIAAHGKATDVVIQFQPVGAKPEPQAPPTVPGTPSPQPAQPQAPQSSPSPK